MKHGVISVMENALAASAIQPQLDLILAAMHHKCTDLHVQG
jgi:hypothetical protein